MKVKLQFALGTALFGCVAGFIISNSSYGLRTTDWAVRGVPISEQVWNEIVIHGFPGGLVGFTIGFLVGMVIPKSLATRLSMISPEPTLKPVTKSIIFLIMFLTVAVYFYFIDPTLVTVGVNFCILFVIYYVGAYLFGKREDNS